MRRQQTSLPSPSKTLNAGPRFATWSSLSMFGGFGIAPCLGGGVLPPWPFERIKDAKRRSEEGGECDKLGLATLHGSEVADSTPDEVGAPDEVGKNGPPIN
eukprot:80505-Alexandrium_andersonii.AAC.1